MRNGHLVTYVRVTTFIMLLLKVHVYHYRGEALTVSRGRGRVTVRFNDSDAVLLV